MEKIDLIYILGFDHSGSTLLDMLLGSLPKVFSTGEIWALKIWAEYDRKCTCSAPISMCPIWSEVDRYIQTKYGWRLSGIHDMNELRNLSWSHRTLSLLRRQIISPYSTEEAKVYGKREHELFSTLRRITGATTFIDSSKYLERLMKLKQSGFFNINIIHLVRNGQALLDANRRAVQRASAQRTRPVFAPLDILFWVIIANRQLRYLANNQSLPYIRVSYKELAQHPGVTIDRICKFAEITNSLHICDPTSPDYIFRQSHHLIGGNRMATSPPDTLIEYRSEWTKRITNLDRFWFRVVGGANTNRALGIE